MRAVLTPRQLLVVQEVTYVTTNGLIKVALLMMYSRIFTFQQIKWAVLVTGFMSVGLTLVVIPVAVFQCNPIEKAWNPFMPGVFTTHPSPLPPVSAVIDGGCSRASS